MSAIQFIVDISKPNGILPQIGDNDSGRFIRLLGDYCSKDSKATSSLHKNLNCTLGWLGLILPILPRQIIDAISPAYIDQSYVSFGRLILSAYSKDRNPTKWKKSYLSIAPTPDCSSPSHFINQFIGGSTYNVIDELMIEGSGILDELEVCQYPDFGLFIFKSSRMYLSIRCGYAKWDSSGCHAHEDQLSLEIIIDGEDISRDPGTYVYTPSRELRNLYRSSTTHVAPCTQHIKSQFYKSCDSSPPFASPKHYFGKCIDLSKRRFVGTSSVDGGNVMRKVELLEDRLVIHDYYRLDGAWYAPNKSLFSPLVSIPFSPGYGQ